MSRDHDDRKLGPSGQSTTERLLWRILRGQRLILMALGQLGQLERLELKELDMARFDMQRLIDATARNTDATAAVQKMIADLTAQIREVQDDPQQLEDVLSHIEANNQALSVAATANTPADSGQPVPPATPPTDDSGSAGSSGGSTGNIRPNT